jgi:hypothetical protein
VQGINEDVKRKLAEGEVSDPFTRRKTKPVLSTGGKVRLIVKVKGTVSIDISKMFREIYTTWPS